MPQVTLALKILGLAFRDTWQEFGTILVVHLLFVLGNILILPGPPATLALFYYGNKIAHGEIATERDFLYAIRIYWFPAWRWGFVNLLIIGLLTGDYYLVETWTDNPNIISLVQGLYIALLAGWFLLQLFTLPFLFEQEQPSISHAFRNAAVFTGKNLILVLTLALLLGVSLIVGTLAFMLTFAFGGAFVAFASNHAVLKDLAGD
jgi:hypothetical protein